MLLQERIFIGAFVCLFAFRTYVATGMHSLIVPMLKPGLRLGKRRSGKIRFVPSGAFSTIIGGLKNMRRRLSSRFGNNSAILSEDDRLIGDSIPLYQVNLDLEDIEQINCTSIESRRLFGGSPDWRKWGPYLSGRQWSTVREDYSVDGNSWEYFPHDIARSRAYRWGEDGLLGFADETCQLCFSLCLWNGNDPILKERLFGLTGTEGNHGEDCKECFYYLDSTPTHSYMKALYKYPQQQYPYSQLVETNMSRSIHDKEFELLDTGIFNESRYWDVCIEYAKLDVSPVITLVRVTIVNRSSEDSEIQVIPQMWYRNTWSWSEDAANNQPLMQLVDANHVVGQSAIVGRSHFVAGAGPDGELPNFIFTNNETNTERINGSESSTPFTKDAFHRYIINGDVNAINPDNEGSKVGAQYKLQIPANGEVVLKLILATDNVTPVFTQNYFDVKFDKVFELRQKEADGFYKSVLPGGFNEQQIAIARQAYAGILWNKQYYELNVDQWAREIGDEFMIDGSRRDMFIKNWSTLNYSGVFSVVDKWEYPWMSGWDTAFSVVPLAKVDGFLAMKQLETILKRENMGINGEIPSCEFNLCDVNPPVIAWAVWKVYSTAKFVDEGKKLEFLKTSFYALMINFKCWLANEDDEGKTILSGGCFQMNNIGFFDCSKEIAGFKVTQPDLTPWAVFFCQNLIRISLKLVQYDAPTYEESLTELCQTYIQLVDTIEKLKLWNDLDKIQYNYLRCDGVNIQVYIRSYACLIPLFGCLVLEKNKLKNLSKFQKMIEASKQAYPNLKDRISFLNDDLDNGTQHIMSIFTPEQLKATLKYMLLENELLSPYGIRSLSKFHECFPFTIKIKGGSQTIEYSPGDSNNYTFGGNNNWRGPVWLNINYLIIESLEEYYSYYGDNYKVEFPVYCEQYRNLLEISQEICLRITRLFTPNNETGYRPCHGSESTLYQSDEHWKNLVLFYECFNCETGKGIGASHATGWSSLAIDCMEKLAR